MAQELSTAPARDFPTGTVEALRFSCRTTKWVPDQLRRHSARSTMTFAQQLVADAALAAGETMIVEQGAMSAGERLTVHDALAVGERL